MWTEKKWNESIQVKRKTNVRQTIRWTIVQKCVRERKRLLCAKDYFPAENFIYIIIFQYASNSFRSFIIFFALIYSVCTSSFVVFELLYEIRNTTSVSEINVCCFPILKLKTEKKSLLSIRFENLYANFSQLFMMNLWICYFLMCQYINDLIRNSPISTVHAWSKLRIIFPSVFTFSRREREK